MKQSDIFVLDKCEITVDKKIILWTRSGFTQYEKVKKCYFVSRSPLYIYIYIYIYIDTQIDTRFDVYFFLYRPNILFT